ncbi:Retrovirus-related Pol polyprotein, partial [Mucuna pruriens]
MGLPTDSRSSIEDRSEKGKEVLIISRKVVRKVLLAQKELLYLLPTNCFHLSTQFCELPTGFKQMLESFQDIFPKDIRHELPPIRGVGKHIKKGWVRENNSPCVVPAIIVTKKDGSWRMYMDYHPINAITVRYRHPIPYLDDLLDKLHSSCIFSQIDL